MTPPLGILTEPSARPRIWVAGPVDELLAACATGLPQAIVTNPDLVAGWFKTDGIAPEQTAVRLVGETGLPVFLQLHGSDRDAFLRQADAIQALDPLLIPKLPATAAGLAAAAVLSAGLPVLITAVASLSQAAAAATAKARFLCPYFARLRDGGVDPEALCRDSAALFSRLGCATEIVPASIRTAADFELAMNAGSTGAIVFTGLFRDLLEHPTVQQALDGFEAAWKILPESILSS